MYNGKHYLHKWAGFIMVLLCFNISTKTSLEDICHDAMQTAFISCCNTERVKYENPNKCTSKSLKTHLDYTVISFQQRKLLNKKLAGISTNTEFKLNLWTKFNTKHFRHVTHSNAQHFLRHKLIVKNSLSVS